MGLYGKNKGEEGRGEETQINLNVGTEEEEL